MSGWCGDITCMRSLRCCSDSRLEELAVALDRIWTGLVAADLVGSPAAATSV